MEKNASLTSWNVSNLSVWYILVKFMMPDLNTIRMSPTNMLCYISSKAEQRFWKKGCFVPFKVFFSFYWCRVFTSDHTLSCHCLLWFSNTLTKYHWMIKGNSQPKTNDCVWLAPQPLPSLIWAVIWDLTAALLPETMKNSRELHRLTLAYTAATSLKSYKDPTNPTINVYPHPHSHSTPDTHTHTSGEMIMVANKKTVADSPLCPFLINSSCCGREKQHEETLTHVGPDSQRALPQIITRKKCQMKKGPAIFREPTVLFKTYPDILILNYISLIYLTCKFSEVMPSRPISLMNGLMKT